jgi:transcription elongation factor Elf1
MARSSFVEQAFTCSICGAQFRALAGGAPVADPVCMSCGLRYSAEVRKRLVDARRKQRP